MATTTNAGPSGLPAAILHPTDTPSKVWRIVSEWEHDGERGAWVERNDQHHAGELAQLVYRDDAPQGRSLGVIGRALSVARDGLSCVARPRSWYHDGDGRWRSYIGRGTAARDYDVRKTFYPDVDMDQIDSAEQLKWHRTTDRWTTLEEIQRSWNTELRLAAIEGRKPGEKKPELRDTLAEAARSRGGALVRSGVNTFVATIAPRVLGIGREHGPEDAWKAIDTSRGVVVEQMSDSFADDVAEGLAVLVEAAFGPDPRQEKEPERPTIPDVFLDAFDDDKPPVSDAD